jgi:hypothetical protein
MTADLFIQLVLMFQMNAMQALGKIRNPLTDRVERNLDAARFSIDLLDMLQEKTKGNLGPEEERLLRQVVQDLKLNYVDEAAKPEPPSPGGPPPADTAEGDPGKSPPEASPGGSPS